MRTIIIPLAVIAMCSLSHAATWLVPDQFNTIQEAIFASVSGDTIIVRPGTYVENINFKGKAITVASEQGPLVTVIDGGQPADPDLGSVVIFQNDEGPNSVLDGFGLTNGSGTLHMGSYYDGGGIYCEAAAPTITNNIISKNAVSGSPAYVGGGIYCLNASPSITNNTISDNTASGEGGGVFFEGGSSPWIEGNIVTNNWASRYAAGIACYNNCAPTIINNIITNNTVDLYHGGGISMGTHCSGTIMNNIVSGNTVNKHGAGIFCEKNSSPDIINNIVSGNTAKSEGAGIFLREDCSPRIEGNIVTDNHAELHGGGIEFFKNCTPIIVNNTITNNTAKDDGGGIAWGLDCSGTIMNNTIAGNVVGRSGAGIACEVNSHFIVTNNTIFGNTAGVSGGGIWCTKGTTLEISNTILWDNESPAGPEIWIGSTADPSTVTISYSDVDGGQASAHVDSGCTLNWGAGMIDADPLFVEEAEQDLHLTYLSPCRDTGDNSAVTELYDIEGDPRMAWGGAVDLGADEFYTHLYVTGDKTPGGLIKGKLVGLPGTNPVGLFIGSGILPSPIPTMWGEFWLQSPWILLGPIGAIPSDGVKVITTTLPMSPPAPYDVPMQALIGLNSDSLTNLCVLQVR